MKTSIRCLFTVLGFAVTGLFTQAVAADTGSSTAPQHHHHRHHHHVGKGHHKGHHHHAWKGHKSGQNTAG